MGILLFAESAQSQTKGIFLRPDIGAPGMTIVLEVLAPASAIKPFGDDGLNLNSNPPVQISLVHPEDSSRIRIFPQGAEVSWNGHLLQVPIFIAPNASAGPVPITVFSSKGGLGTATLIFTIANPQHLGDLSGDVVIGLQRGALSASNTILVDSLTTLATQSSHITFSLDDPDTNAGNPRLQPVSIFSLGPVRLKNATISVDANGIDGGPGGGGAGHSYEGVGGNGFTGGGNSSDTVLPTTSQGSGSEGTLTQGGASITGVLGGGSIFEDQGGGGGTGAPYGSSGDSGMRGTNGKPGRYGGGSAGGEDGTSLILFGGGGGGFGTSGSGGGTSSGIDRNGGSMNGGRFLVPLAGGSGGGAGNANGGFTNQPPEGGSGAGGGGALSIVCFDSISLESSSISARGDSGQSEVIHVAGGGGGSGGAIVLSSPHLIHATNTQLSVSGGRGGFGGANEYPGGAGGLGRIRIDGPNDLQFNLQQQNIAAKGISITPIASLQVGPNILLSGFALDTNNFYDSIRIFYRTGHSGWQFVDTVRDRVHGTWSKWIAAGHDSLLYAIAMIKVFNPSSDVANYEPEWLMSHVGMTIVHHKPSSLLVLQQDSLDFGKVHLNHCATKWLHIRNEGEEPLVIDSILSKFTSTDFTFVGGDTIISGYTNDSIEVRFCPDTSGTYREHLTLVTNDSANANKQIVLKGIGLVLKDSLTVHFSPVHFGHVFVGKCESDTVTLKSVGADIVNLNFKSYTAPPFSFQLIPSDSSLGPGDSARLVVTFCPVDTLVHMYSLLLDTKDDSLVVTGHGYTREERTIGKANITACANRALMLQDTIYNIGNDTATLYFAKSKSGDSVSYNTIVGPGQRLPITWQFPIGPRDVTYFDTMTYRIGDTIVSTFFTIAAVEPDVHVDSVLAFHFTCVGSSDTLTLHVRNVEVQPLTTADLLLSKGTDFRSLDSLPNRLDTTANIRIVFAPTALATSSDTIHFRIATIACDSFYSIPISGTGVTGPLAAEPLQFDSVTIGNCREDSILVQNSCGPPQHIDSVTFHRTEFKLLTSLPITIGSHGKQYLHFRFCPSAPGVSIDTVAISYDSDSIHTVLRGIAVDRVSPFVYLRASSSTVVAGDTAYTDIILDSSSLAGDHTFSDTVTFDPTVLWLLGGRPHFAGLITPHSLVVSGTINFDSPGQVFETLLWRTLLGAHDYSNVSSIFVTDTPIALHAADGVVHIVDCGNLAGRASVAGEYELSAVTPNPSSGEATVSLQLGSDGPVSAQVYDLAGQPVATVLDRWLNRSTYIVHLPTARLSSGRYFLVVRSMGWSGIQPFIIWR